MVSRVALVLSALALVLPAMADIPKAASWSIEADLAESCCCNAACPCLFGSPPTRGHCQGARLVEIKKGHYEDVSLNGLSLVVVFDMGKWTKIYVSDKASEQQVVSAKALLQKLKGFVFGKLLEVTKTPLKVERTKGTFKFSSPRATVDMAVMKGRDGKPIQIKNLAEFRGYTQYKSVTIEHKDESKSHTFKYSGTNGFTAKYEKSSPQ